MRFCNLKTYLSACRQFIVFHPSIFDCESDLGLSITTYTFSSWHIAIHVGISWQFCHPFSGINPLFRVRLLLFEPSFPFISCGWLPTYRSTTVGDMKGLLRSCYPLFESFRVCLSTGVLGCALTQLKEFVRPYPCQIFPAQEVDFSTSLYPLVPV